MTERVTTETQLALLVASQTVLTSEVASVKDAIHILASAVQKLALIEDRQVSDRAAIGRAFTDIGDHETRLRALEQSAPIQKQSSEWVSKIISQIISILVAAVIGTVVATRFAAPAAPQHQTPGATP